MLLRTGRNRLPRDYCRQRQARNGSAETKWGGRLASAQKSHRRPFLPRVHRLLPIFHPQLLQNRLTSPRSNQEEPSMVLGRTPVQSLRNPENHHVPKTGPYSTRLRATLLPANRRLGLWDWSSALPGARRRRHPSGQKGKTQTPPYCILLRHVHPNRTKLRHLQTGVACHDESPRPLEALPRLDQTPLYCPHRSRKPPILEVAAKSELMNDPVARRSSRIRLRDQIHTLQDQHTPQRPVTSPGG